MPRYYFHVHDGEAVLERIAITLNGDDHARDQAIVAAAEALKSLGSGFWGHGDWRMHVTDERGATVCDLRLSNQPGPA